MRSVWQFRRSLVFFFSSRRRHTRYIGDWSSDVCSSDLTSHLLGGQQDRGFGRRNAVDQADLVEGATEFAEVFGVELGDQVPAAVGGVDLVDLREIGSATCRRIVG